MKRLVIFGFASFCLYADDINTVLRRADEHFRRGAYKEAYTEMNNALRSLEGAKPTGLMVTLLNNLGDLQADFENPKDSEKLYLRALRIWDQLDATDRPSRLTIQLNLLGLYLDTGWLHKAERMAEKSARDFDRADSEQRIQFLHCIGNLKRLQKHFDQAEVQIRAALALAEAAGDSGAAGYLWNSIGIVLAERKIISSTGAFEQSLYNHERAGRQEHPALIPTLINLGAAYLAENRAGSAQAVLERAKSLAERFFDDSHSSLRTILLLEARTFDRMNRRTEAKQARQRAQAISRASGSRRTDAFVIDIEDLRLK